MKFVRLSTVGAFVLAIATGTALFCTSQKVQVAENKVSALEHQKIKEQEAIRVLHAEWDYLNRPDRLEALATRYLGMKQPVLTAVTDNPKNLAVSFPAPVSSGHKPPLATQAVAFHAQPVPSVAPPPTDDQRSFQDLISHLSSGDDK